MEKENSEQTNTGAQIIQEKKPFFKTTKGVALIVFFIIVIILFLFTFLKYKNTKVSDKNTGIPSISEEQKKEILKKNADTKPITEEQRQSILEKNVDTKPITEEQRKSILEKYSQ